MNNYELHEAAQQLADTNTAYQLAKELILLREGADKVKADAVREAAKSIGIGESMIYRTDLVYYAEKLERGEI